MATIPLVDQERQARTAWLDAHRALQVAAAELDEAKGRVGSNETDRKTKRSKSTEQEYEIWFEELRVAEATYSEARAHEQRTEKILNCLREEVQRETADVHMRAADRFFEAVTISDTTAQRYAVMPGNYTTHAEFRARYPTATGNGIKRATVSADDSADELPF